FRRDLTNLVDTSKRAAPLVAVVKLAPHLRKDQSPDEQVRAAQTSLYYSPFISIPDFLRLYESYNQAITQTASNTGVLLISDEYSIPGTSEYFADSAHFTDKGSHLMAQRVSRELIKSH